MMMLLVAGLGNPGAGHEKNRHNIGFMAVDAIHERYHFSPWSKKFQALVADGMIGDVKILLVKPQTYMNLSGQAIGEIMRFYKLSADDLVVIHDELDLPQGKVRLKKGGGSGGHNGIKSIDSHCDSRYRRVRLGIGHPGHKDMVHNHVLGNFARTDDLWLTPVIASVAEHIGLLASGHDSTFIHRIAGSTGSEHGRTAGKQPDKQPDRQQSHIRAARPAAVKKQQPGGLMADMLGKLFKPGNKAD